MNRDQKDGYHWNLTMNDSMQYRVLLYYHYTTIENPAHFAADHRAMCTKLGLLGRILIAGEGINGTVSGTITQTDQYMAALQGDPRFREISFKIDETHGHVFKKLIVKARAELVTLRLEQDVDPRVQTGKRLSPREFHVALQSKDVIVVDARNSYEFEVGHFRGAIKPSVKTFKEFPQWVRENLVEYKDKTVLTYCTGGIRCEKFSAFLLQEGFKNVGQLEGGILSYGKDDEVKGRLFDGRCYVFDQRACVDINRTEEATIVGRCHHCRQPSERLVNCANTQCDNQHICCIACEMEHRRSCSEECKTAPIHEFDPVTAGTEKSFYR